MGHPRSMRFSATAGIALLILLATSATDAGAQSNGLEVTKDGPTVATVNEVLTFTVVVTNTGLDAATDVVMNDLLPSNTVSPPTPVGAAVFTSVTEPSGWTCTTPAVGDHGAVSCLTLSLAPSASATFTVVMTAIIEGTFKNEAIVAAGNRGGSSFDDHYFTVGPATPTPTPTVAPTATPVPTATPGPTATPEPSVAPTVEPTATPVVEPTPTSNGGTGSGGGGNDDSATDGNVGADGGAADDGSDGQVGAGGGAAPDGGSLPATGSDATTLSVMAMLAIAMGALLLIGGFIVRPATVTELPRHARNAVERFRSHRSSASDRLD